MLLLLFACTRHSVTFDAEDSAGSPHDSGATTTAPDDPDGDGFTGADDCDERRADVNAGATERCDGLDDDCDGTVDEPSAVDAGTWYADADADGFGDADRTETGCAAPEGYVADATDCDDGDAAWHPGADESDCTDPNDYDCDGSVGYADADADGYAACADCDDGNAAVNADADEVCDGLDDDCDGTIDEASAVDAGTWYADADADGYGDADLPEIGCLAPDGYVADATDCDDGNAAWHPDADESDCTNPNDYDCDGVVAYADLDADGDPACTDCDDGNAAVNADADEVCDGLDDDCDGTIDEPEAVDAATWYADADADGYGDAADTAVGCDAPAGYVGDASDCDDAVLTSNPGAVETCGDGADDDCDGGADCADDDCADELVCTHPCADADLGSVTGDAVASGTTVGAGDDTAATCSTSGAEDVSYLWVAPSTGDFTFSTDGSDYATALVVSVGDCSGAELGCDDDGSGASSVTLTLTAGDEVMLTVDGHDAASGRYVLDICDRGADADCDGVLAADDCDDDDDALGASADDADCDGTVTTDDCDDANPNQPDPLGNCATPYTTDWGHPMLVIDPGTFTMGAVAHDAYMDHEVELTHTFWLERHEVTQDEWASWTGAPDPAPSHFVGGDLPVETVSWADAAQYANALSAAEGLAECYESDGSDVAAAYAGNPYECPGYRLPTEAEWEYAALAGEYTAYAGSDNPYDVAWTDYNSGGTTHDVCTLAPNAWDLCDMSGNVWEWTNDWYPYGWEDGYDTGAASVDPWGAPTGYYRVFRGSSWQSLNYLTKRGYYPSTPGPHLGFRLARSSLE